MPNSTSAARLNLRTDQIIIACWEWAERRGLKPSSIHTMDVMIGRESIDPKTHKKRVWPEVTFICDQPTAPTYETEDGKLYPSTTRRDAPWLKEYAPYKPETI